MDAIHRQTNGAGNHMSDLGGSKPDKPSASSSQLVLKVASIIELLGERGPSTATEVASAINEPRSSVYRLLRYLDNIGWIEPGTLPGTWDLGVRLYRLSARAVHRLDFTRAVRPHLDQLHSATGQTVYLCVRNRWEAVCIDRIDGREVTSLELQLGGSLPLHLGGAPTALLAFSDEHVRSAWEKWAREAESSRRGDRSALDVDKILARVEQIRGRGFSVSRGDVTKGIASVGAPIFDHSGQLRAALSVSGLAESILDVDDGIREHATAAARAASLALGYEGAS